MFLRARHHHLAGRRRGPARVWERLVWAERRSAERWRAALAVEMASLKSPASAADPHGGLPGSPLLHQLPGPAATAGELAVDARPAHAGDFSSVHWFGDTYNFTPGQAAAVEHLWAEWERRPGLGLRESTLAERVDAGDAFRLSKLFRGHPAFGRMIVAGDAKGVFRLCPPNGHQTPT